MKRLKSFLSTFLLLLGVACAFVALVFGAGYALQYIQSEQTIESLRPDTGDESNETPSSENEITSSEDAETSSSDSQDSSSENAETSSSDSQNSSSENAETSSSDSQNSSSENAETSSSDSQDSSSEDAETSSSDNQDSSSEDTETPATESEASSSENTEVVAVPHPYAESFLKNEDMAAWLVIPGTNIDYPVMWTPEDENYYLYKDFNGNENVNGCLILDTDSCLDPLTTNQIIHGHNMKSGAMFGNLTDYEDQNYYKEHKQITLYTESCQRNYEIIAVFRSQVYKKTDTVFKFYKFFQADTEEEFNDFYQNIKDLSIYDTGVTAEFGDNFITLSTCVYHVENGRFVVVAKEIEQGDTYLPLD